MLDAVRSSSVLLAVIGPRWFAEDASGARLIDDPNDWIRRELVTAFENGVTVIPVFTDGATPPRPDELPDDIRQLGRQNGLWLHRDRAAADMAAIVRKVAAHAPVRRRQVLLGTVVMAVVVVIATIAVLSQGHDEPNQGPPTDPKGPSSGSAIATTPAMREPQVWWQGTLTFNAEAFVTGYSLDTSPPTRQPAGDIGLMCDLSCAGNELGGTAFVPWTGAGYPDRQQCVDLLNGNVGQRTLSVKAGTKACVGTVGMRVGYLEVTDIGGPGQMKVDVKVWDVPPG